MIGKIMIGKSFRGCISYCLEDKVKKLKNEQVVRDRAEVLSHNLCYGNKLDLIKQFNEVRNLNPKLSKPVMHITLSLSPGEGLSKGNLASLVEECAKDMGFEKNQYVAIHHNDTGHQHIHIVTNRVGFDRKTVKDSHNFQKIAAYCRKMELKYGLKQVLSPRRYLSKELRQIPRLDLRKEKFRQDIRECLSTASNYREFEQRMKQRKYLVLKARGIAFIDPQKVRVKGSEVGYSLSKIEKILSLQPEQKKTVLQQEQLKEMAKPQIQQQQLSIIQQKNLEKSKSLKEATELLIKPTPFQENINPALLKKKRRKKRNLYL
ncbi:MAG: relaxase/mobilization nuclease domain-containing protein [Terrimonas sp.]|nr:relaxase/mobilization nuclease domain-containing protein [Terrimonas sp.]